MVRLEGKAICEARLESRGETLGCAATADTLAGGACSAAFLALRCGLDLAPVAAEAVWRAFDVLLPALLLLPPSPPLSYPEKWVAALLNGCLAIAAAAASWAS